MRRVSTVTAARKSPTVADEEMVRLRSEANEAQRRLDEAEEALEKERTRLSAEKRIARRGSGTRMTIRQLDDLEAHASHELVVCAVDELRDATLSVHEHNVADGLYAKLTGDERDVLERLLAMTAPRELR